MCVLWNEAFICTAKLNIIIITVCFYELLCVKSYYEIIACPTLAR